MVILKPIGFAQQTKCNQNIPFIYGYRIRKGTIAGAGGTGAAPGSKWIACLGCNTSKCDEGMLLACSDWILAPTNADGSGKDVSFIPDVVNNSWDDLHGGYSWYGRLNALKAVNATLTPANGPP